MLATRAFETEHSHWPFGKSFPSPRKSSESPRMSDHYEHPLPTQPDWQGQYPYLPQSGAAVYSQPSESTHGPSEAAHPHTGANNESLRLGAHDDGRATIPTSHHQTLGRRGVQGTGHSSQMPELSENKGDLYMSKTSHHPLSESMASTEAAGVPSASTQPNSISSLIQSSRDPSRGYGPEDHDQVTCSKDDGENLLDDDDVVEAGTEAPQPQTTAERVAARRKMKRFRLTHQQTRFLSSEFAKQPHPDAAHRERLSREIPGLSPRQVQVWFQNRRAKIKRHNAEDRERMIKMRAVPDDFDNVQALHSPYGAMNMPLAPLVDFTNPSYANPMMRPLMVDVRRQDGNDQISPTGLAPSFPNIGFNPSSGLNPSGIISPLSPGSNDRYTHSSHPSTTLGGSHGSLDSAMQAHRPGIRPIQPFPIRDVMSRPRSESLQSPLRPGMPWKTEPMDYYVYQGINNTSQPMTDRPPIVYQPSQLGQAPSGGIGGLDRSSYSSNSTSQPSSGLNYSTFQSTTQNGSRHRTASASSASVGVDHQYREGSVLHSPSQSSSSNRPSGSSSHYSASSAYTTSYAPASLTAPLDASQPRSTQINLPAVPISDFPQPMPASIASHDQRPEVRDVFHNGSIDYHHSQDRAESYGEDFSANTFKRERSYTLSGSAGAALSDARSQSHGSTA